MWDSCSCSYNDHDTWLEVFMGGGEGYHGGMRVRHDVEPEKLPAVSRVLRAYRIAANLTQAQLSQEMGYSRGYAGLIECGTGLPSPEYIRAQCRVLGLSLSEEQRLLHLRQTAGPLEPIR
jgi:DNA-binding XRE family transcriptional regulator